MATDVGLLVCTCGRNHSCSVPHPRSLTAWKRRSEICTSPLPYVQSLMQVRALMNYAYILKSERKAASTRATYDEALTLARTQVG